jgi:hypothetical protein
MDAIDRVPYDACKPLEYRVLVKLANVAAQDGTRAFRNQEQMADELGVSVRSIQRALKQLEAERLIIRGDQRILSHERADRRPVVYDINMRKCLDWEAYHAEPLVNVDGVTHGVTEISTGAHGVTNDTTTAVAHRELMELTTSTSKGDHTADVTPCAECGDPLPTSQRRNRVCIRCASGITQATRERERVLA